MNNIIGIYKPKGLTSFDVVRIIKKITGKKVGHAGTLDPLASGVLVIGIGRQGTKKLKEIVLHEKEYIAKIKLGQISKTDDEEGDKVTKEVLKIPEIDDIKRVIKNFIGKIKQVPPLYSAIKIKGKEAYKYARQGKKIKLKAREVQIKSIEILKYSWPFLEIKVVCGPGVYIRSLARDIGEKLATGAYLADLERTRVGNFRKETCLSIFDFKNLTLNKTSLINTF
jgi:tRNA pseudouridine55 synthase